MDTLNVVFGIVTIISLLVTIYYGRKASVLEMQKKRLEWTDIQASANDLGDKIKQSGFIPEVIFTPGLRAASFVGILKTEFNNINIPSFVGLSFWKGQAFDLNCITSHEKVITNKWEVLVPECLSAFKEKRLLIVDDFAMSGDFILAVKNLLLSNGFEEKNIKTATIAVTKVAIANNKKPDYYWMEANDNNFYFPWGKAK